MEHIINAISALDLVIPNSRFFWIAYAVLLVFALAVRKTTDKKRRTIGNALLISYIPGLLMCAVNIILMLVTFVTAFYISIKYNHPIYSHDPAKNLYDMNNTIPINCLWLSCLLIPLNGIVLFVCGVILRKKTNYNVLGVISYILSALSILYGIIVLLLLASGLD